MTELFPGAQLILRLLLLLLLLLLNRIQEIMGESGFGGRWSPTVHCAIGIRR